MSEAKLRFENLDIMRGLTITMLMLTMVPWLSGYYVVNRVALEPGFYGVLDNALFTIIYFLFIGKAVYLFAFMFGIGISIQIKNARARLQPDFDAYFIRRMLWLFLFGVLNSVFLWPGDVLRFYALVGLLLLPIACYPQRVLLILAAAAIFYPLVMLLLDYYFALGLPSLPRGAVISPEYSLYIHQSGSYWDFMVNNVTDSLARFLRRLHLSNGEGFKLFASMLIGVLIGRSSVLSNVDLYRRKLKQYILWILPISAFSEGIYTLVRYGNVEAEWLYFLREPGIGKILYQLLHTLGTLGLAISYLCIVALVLQNEKFYRKLHFFSYVGRGALTNYILMVFLAGLVFYGPFGLGFYGQLSFAMSLIVIIGIFLIQIILCRLWFIYFKMGPLEKVWRKLAN